MYFKYMYVCRSTLNISFSLPACNDNSDILEVLQVTLFRLQICYLDIYTHTYILYTVF